MQGVLDRAKQCALAKAGCADKARQGMLDSLVCA